MLRALQRFLGTEIPVIGVNFGRVGFLASIQPNELESGLARVFSGDYRVVSLTTLDVDADGTHGAAVNDVVVLSSIRGRMVELAWAFGGEDLGVQPCDGMICSTPSGSTAYNLSNGGPVLVRGLEAMAVTFIAPHSLHARPMVVPPDLDLEIRNRTPDVSVSVLVDGHGLAEVGTGAPITVRLGKQHSLLATLPEATFFRRYRETFASKHTRRTSITRLSPVGDYARPHGEGGGVPAVRRVYIYKRDGSPPARSSGAVSGPL
jgi:NAD+ kinase